MKPHPNFNYTSICEVFSYPVIILKLPTYGPLMCTKIPKANLQIPKTTGPGK